MKKRKKRRIGLFLIAVLMAVYCNFSLHTEQWTVISARLPAAFDGYRIALLTDIHGGQFGPDSETLLKAVRETKPDLIAIGGDLADEFSDTSVLPPLLRGLSDIAPTFYVTGNHEWVREDTEELIGEITACGVTVLRNDWQSLTKDGETIILAGAEDPNGYADMDSPETLMERLRKAHPEDPYTAVLYHRNDALSLWSELEPDLLLSGHGHGGVIRLPFVGGLLGVDRRPFPQNAEGLYTEGRTTMAVSRGLGGIRLWNRPHLPVIVLRCE